MACSVVHCEFVCDVPVHEDSFNAVLFFFIYLFLIFIFSLEEIFSSLTKFRRYEWNYIGTRLMVKRFEGRTIGDGLRSQ